MAERNRSRIVPFPFCQIKLKAQKPPKDWYSKSFYRQHMSSTISIIKHKRLELGITQAALAKRLNVRVENVWNWEHSRTIPDIHYLPKIIEFLGYDPLETGKKAD
jgi:DNA-binding transcriptional regulator YiaG